MAEHVPTLQEMQDDIDLYTTLLESLGPNPSSDQMEDREDWEEKLAGLKARMANMGDGFSQEHGRLPTSLSSHTDGSSDDAGPASNRFLSLPSRKRDRGEFDNDDTSSMPKNKSRRSTPLDSPAPSVASIDSNYFDDSSFGNLFGDDLKEDVRNNKQYLRNLEATRKQQQEDERLARQLAEEWNSFPDPPSQPPGPQHNWSFNSQQSVFRPDGSFSAPAPRLKPENKNFSVQQEIKDEFPASPATVSSDDDSLTFVSPTEWDRRFPSFAGPLRVLPQTFGQSQYIPGAFPTTGQPLYSSMPGTSVYGANASQHSQGLTPLDRFVTLGRMSMGSLANPFDVESMVGSRPPLPSEWEEADPLQTQEEIKQLLSHIRPDEEIDVSEAGENQPAGLKVKLMPHQVKGLAWMKKMEDGSNKGGILADDMGLGKTIQAIALMLSRPPPDNARRPTLVVTPVALMEQWRREFLKLVRAKYQFTVQVLHGQHSRIPWAQIKHFDVVLTSYGTLASEMKRKQALDDKLKLNPDYQPKRVDECPTLGEKAKFHRIFLDEAQNIKNQSTKAAHAACRVQADFRWCLSGTPMQNSVEEIYSMIRFCRIRPYNDREMFNKSIARPLKGSYRAGQDRAMEKLQALLKAILLRRTKKSMIDGQPILQLPEKHTIEERTVFNQDQLAFYQNLEAQTRIQFNRYVKAGTVGQNYSKALVLLLRLRQCCCSPQLVTNSADFVTDSGVEGIDLVANAKELPKDVTARIKEQEDVECPICMDACENAIIFNPCGHALCHECFSKMVDNVMQEEGGNVKCPHCRAKIDTKKITDHASFAEVYLGAQPASVVDDDEDDGADESTDVNSDSDDDEVETDGSDDGGDLKDFIVDDEDEASLFFSDPDTDDDDDLDQMKSTKKPALTLPSMDKKEKKSKNKQLRKSKKSKGKDKKKEHKSLADLRKEGLKSRVAKRKYLKQLSKIYEPCAKIDKTLELLQQIQDRGENEKTIVFSSFTSFLDLVEVPLSAHTNLKDYARYDGSMTAKDRNAAVLRFTDDPNCRVILVSLKAGNAGLNLTIANHVIILDPFWNPFVEYQAADRCHRIGQRREVTVHRVLIGEEGIDYQDVEKEPTVFTVEDRILALQAKKKKLVDAALDENAASSVGRLGVRELGFLFGVSGLSGGAGG